MKRVFYFCVFAVLFMAGCAVKTNSVADYIGNTTLGFDPKTPMEQRSFLKVDDFINIVYIAKRADDNNSIVFVMNEYQQKGGFIPSGFLVLNVQFSAFTSRNTLSTSSIVPVSFNFEAGKSYYIDYKITKNKSSQDTISFSVNEITDPADPAKDIFAFFAFSKANPSYLKGTWTYSDEYPFNDHEIIFNNKDFKTKSFNRVSKITLVTEGKYFFNENTIILVYEKRDNEKYNKYNEMQYELKNGLLYIYSGGNDAVITIGGLEGEYNKK